MGIQAPGILKQRKGRKGGDRFHDQPLRPDSQAGDGC